MSQMIKCKTCGADIAAKAKTCPQCGAQNKKPVYKKWWFWVIIVFVLIILAVSNSEDSNKDQPASSSAQTSEQSSTDYNTETAIEYIACDVTDLFDALKDNALKAQNTYKDQYVEISGYLGTIDSSGKYITVCAAPTNYDYILQSVRCDIDKNSDQLEKIMEMKKDDPIKVKGKITTVGEVLGYSLKIDSIE